MKYIIKYKELLINFFDELDMKNSYLQEYDKHREHLSNSYDKNHKLAPLDKNPLLGGAYGIITTLPDLTKFMKFQLESNDPLIKESARFLFKDVEDEDNDTGYLWDVGIGEKEGFYHSKTGTSNGVQSGVLICKNSNYGLVLFMNNKSDTALNDWLNLYYKIESDLIEYPRINLTSLLQPEFINNPKIAFDKYRKLKKDTINAKLNYDKAIATLDKNANNAYSVGRSFESFSLLEQAIITYEKAMVLKPVLNFNMQLARIYGEQGNIEKMFNSYIEF